MRRLALALSLCALLGVASAQEAELLGAPDGDPPRRAEAASADAPPPVSPDLPTMAVREPPEAAPVRNDQLDPAVLRRAGRRASLRAAPRGARDGPPGAVQISYGDLCVDVDGAAALLRACGPAGETFAALVGGDVQIGAARIRVAPLRAPGEGCAEHAVRGARAYLFRICAGEGASTLQNDGDVSLFTTYAAPGETARGAPLVATISGPAMFEYVRRGKQLRLVGSDLCVTPPSQDVRAGAPLYLDLCDAPYGADSARLRATFLIAR